MWHNYLVKIIKFANLLDFLDGHKLHMIKNEIFWSNLDNFVLYILYPKLA